MESELFTLIPELRTGYYWRDFDNRIDKDDSLPESFKTEWKNANQFFSKELGNGFLNDCSRRNPLLNLLSQHSRGFGEEIIDAANCMKSLKQTSSSYPKLLKLLKSKSKVSTEGMPFLEVALRHLQHGFTVHFLDERPDRKTPDIALIHVESGEQLFIEVSKVGDTQNRKAQFRQYRKLVDIIIFEGANLPVAGKLNQFIPEDHLSAILTEIRKLKEKALAKEGIAVLANQYLTLCFCNPESHEELLAWVEENGIAKGFAGLSVNFDDTNRFLNQSRIEDKAKQIPPDGCGLIYFPIQFLFSVQMNHEKMFQLFANRLQSLKNIIGVVLYTESFPFQDKPFILDLPDGHFFANQRKKSGCGRQTYFINNTSFKGSISPQIFEALKKAMI